MLQVRRPIQSALSAIWLQRGIRAGGRLPGSPSMARGLSRAMPVLRPLRRARGTGPLVQATRLTQEVDAINLHTLSITEQDVVRVGGTRPRLARWYGWRIGQGGAGCAKCQEGCGGGREQKSTHDVSHSLLRTKLRVH